MSTDPPRRAPSQKELSQKRFTLNTVEDKPPAEGVVGADPGIVDMFRKAWDDHAGSREKLVASLGLDGAQWPEGGLDKDGFVNKFVGQIREGGANLQKAVGEEGRVIQKALAARFPARRGCPSMVTLYGAALSHPSNAVALALLLKKVPFKLTEPPGSGWHEERGKFKPGYGTEAYKEAMAPLTATMPAIIAEWGEGNTFKVNETTVIMEWIEDTVPGQGTNLFPGGADDKARLRFVTRVHESGLDGKVRALFPLIGGKPDEKVVEEKIGVLREPLATLGQLCDGYGVEGASNVFFNGASWSAADCMLLPTLALLEKMLLFLRGEARREEVVAMYPGRLRTWFDAAKASDEVQAVTKEMNLGVDDWIKRKQTGQEFGDGWWRPEGYGGERNAQYP